MLRSRTCSISRQRAAFERADHSSPALLGSLEDLARAAIAIRTTVSDVVNIDPSSWQAARLVPIGD